VTNRKSSSGPRRVRNPRISGTVLQCFKDLRNEGLPVTKETLISKAKGYARHSNITFKGSRGCCGNLIIMTKNEN
jgi:hypothetical protein